MQEARKVDDVKPKEVNDHEPHSLLPQKHNEDKSKLCKILSMTAVHNTSQALQEVHGASPIQVQIYIYLPDEPSFCVARLIQGISTSDSCPETTNFPPVTQRPCKKVHEEASELVRTLHCEEVLGYQRAAVL